MTIKNAHLYKTFNPQPEVSELDEDADSHFETDSDVDDEQNKDEDGNFRKELLRNNREYNDDANEKKEED